MLVDNLNIAFKNIKERKSRVFLTFLGISIGIMAIVALMGLGEGMQQAVVGELSSLTDTVIVSTGEISIDSMNAGYSGDNGQFFTDRDIDSISRINGIDSIDPILSGVTSVYFNGETKIITVMGLEPDRMSEIFGIEFLGLESGEFMNEGDRNTCIIGYNVAHDYFDTEIKVGNRIKINDKSFFVNGIYKKQGAGFSTQTDDYIHVTTRDFSDLTGSKDISGILIKVSDVNNVENIAEEIEYKINMNHGDDDFASAITMSSILESIQEILSIIQIMLIGIAAIALVVASIGIMNTMLTSVMERTHEIGVMKAIGARNSDIMSIFLIEGIIISLIGGIVGVTLGIGGAQGLGMASSGFMAEGGGMTLQPIITPLIVLLALSVAILVGMISSFYPARKAAKMSPIEAVRYE